MSDKQTFETILEKHENMDATGICVPFDVETIFGAKRVPVKVSINGAEYRSTIVRMSGKYVIAVPKVFREAAGVKGGERITVTLEKDTEPRVITPPADLAEALARNKDAQSNWGKLSYTHQKEYALAVESAKREETRRRRIEKTVETVAALKKKSGEIKMKALLGLIFLAGFIGCFSAVKTANLGEEFILKKGETVEIKNEIPEMQETDKSANLGEKFIVKKDETAQINRTNLQLKMLSAGQAQSEEGGDRPFCKFEVGIKDNTETKTLSVGSSTKVGNLNVKLSSVNTTADSKAKDPWSNTSCGFIVTKSK